MGALGAASGYAIGGDQAAIALGLCSAVVALPFRWTHPHRWKQITQPSGYISWYADPRTGRISYLRWHPAGNVCQEFYGEGHEYVDSEMQASVYENEADARAVTPVYDGSADLGRRVGVKPVFGRKPTRTHLDCCMTCREGGDCGAHLTFPAEKPVPAPVTEKPEVTSALIVQSLFLGVCPDEQTPTVWWFEAAENTHERHFRCKSCDGNWIVRLAKARHMRDYGGFDVEKVQP